MTDLSRPADSNPAPSAWVDGAVALVRRTYQTRMNLPPLAPSRSRRRVSWLGCGAAVALASSLGVVAWRLVPRDDSVDVVLSQPTVPGPGALSYEVVSGIRVAPAAEREEPTIIATSESALLRFSDGSTAVFVAGARGRVRSLHRNGARITVDRGAADLDIVPRQNAAWVVDAGPYSVRVMGTRFVVEWREDAAVFELRLRSGSVEVVGPHIDGARVVRAGERFTIRASDGAMLPHRRAASRRRGAPVAAPEPAPPTLAARHAAGDYNGVVAEATTHGVRRLLENAPASELIALADAARYTRRLVLANDALLALRRRFHGTAVAAEAALARGRMAEDLEHAPAAAITWYDVYLSEEPRGRYAAESLGRKMVAVRATQGDAAAAPIARAYLAAHPSGSYGGVARQILAANP